MNQPIFLIPIGVGWSGIHNDLLYVESNESYHRVDAKEHHDTEDCLCSRLV